MSKNKILIIEDDKHLSKLVKYNLEKSGFHCVAATSGEEGLEKLSQEVIDLIILDIMLPGMDGLQICKEIKRDHRRSHLPVIMLTAKGEEIDRIVGFELGADDYVVKPFSTRELVLRVKAILKRGMDDDGGKDILEFGQLKIDIPRHRVTVSDQEVTLTLMEFNLLLTLVQREGRVQPREMLLDDVWDIEADVTTRTVDTHIRNLRQKLGKMGKLIETVRGIGYRFYEGQASQ